MKYTQKNFSNVIRSIEDARGFDEENDMPTYERFNGQKRSLTEDLELKDKKKMNRRNDDRDFLEFDGSF